MIMCFVVFLTVRIGPLSCSRPAVIVRLILLGNTPHIFFCFGLVHLQVADRFEFPLFYRLDACRSKSMPVLTVFC